MQKSIIIFIVFSIFSGCSFAANVNKEKEKLIDELLKQTKSSSIAFGERFGEVFIRQLTMAIKKSKPNVAPKAYDIVKEVVDNTVEEEINKKDAFNKMLHPIYAKYFSIEELKAIIGFYKSPVGRKYIKVMPQMTREEMIAGQKLGKRLRPILFKRLEERFKRENIDVLHHD